MKYFVPLIFVFSLSFAQNSDLPNNLSSERTLKKDSIIKEFDILYNLLNTFHPGEFMHCEKRSFNRCYDSLSNSIQTDLSITEFYCKASFLISKIKDGHTWVDNFKVKRELDDRLVFPFSIYQANDIFYISKPGTKEYNNLIGSIILKINDKPIEEITSKIKSYLSIEGTNETAVNTTFQQFPFYYFLIDTSTAFKIEYTDSIGNSKVAVLKGIEYKNFIKTTRKVVEPITQEFKENNITILTVNTFYIDDYEYKKINYKKYIDNFFKDLKKKNITNLIIDVRGNSGGSAEVSNYLFSYLTDKQYYYFEYVGKKYKKAGDLKYYSTTSQYIKDVDILATQYRNNLYCEVETNKKDYWWFEKQKGKKKYFKGDVITLIDGGCFSTTGHFIALLKYNKIGKLFGECCQSSYYSNDGGHMFELPYSKFQVRIPTAQFKMRMPNFEYSSKGICPDVELIKTSQDIKTSFDRLLEMAANELLKKY